MNLQEFDKSIVSKFKGLYARGSADLTPQDHAIDLLNVRFDRTGEVYTREGIAQALNLSHPIKRMFLATPKGTAYNILTFDGNQTIYRYDTNTKTDSVFYTNPALQGFAALNMFGKTYIFPMGPVGNSMSLMVWDGTNALRPALGRPPQGGFQAVDGGAGVVDPGRHRIAFSFITNTGYETRPGPVPAGRGFEPINYDAPGNHELVIVGLPVGTPEVVAREIFVTKANQEEFFRVTGGYIADNTTTFVILDFFDTDLVVSADDLFDNRDIIEGAYYDIGGLIKYHGRMMIWGRTLPTDDNPDWGPDKIIVSEPGDPETFNNTRGYIQLPTEFDGNTVRASAEIRDVLYLIKSVGIYSVQDNLDNPFTWPTVRVDGGVGCGFYGISTIVASQTALASGETLLLVDRGGIYVFNGVVQQPQLTWKIKNLWDKVDASRVLQSMICHDPFDQNIYALVPLIGGTWTLLVGDYAEGMDASGIKWSIFSTDFSIDSIALIQFEDISDYNYHLRIGSLARNGMFKLDPNFTTDSSGQIVSSYSTFLAGFGNISIFRALNLRIEGSPYINLGLQTLDADGNSNLGFQNVGKMGINNAPMMEYTRQINYTAERMFVKLDATTPFRLQRVDIYGKTQFMSRPLVSGIR